MRYVLEGSLRKAANRIRITAQLIEAETGVHVWADRYDALLDDLFTVQDELSSSVVGALTPQLEKAEIARVKRKRSTNLNAYDLFLRGLSVVHTHTAEGVAEALCSVQRLIGCRPGVRSRLWRGSDVLFDPQGAQLAIQPSGR